MDKGKKLELIKTINPQMKFLEGLFPYQDSSQRSEWQKNKN